VFLAAASQRTSRIRLAALVYLLPMYHPLRLIEDICMLDNLSGGRLHVGVGRGISPIEHRFWGHEPEQARDFFDEALAVVVRGLTSDTLSFQGNHFSFDRIPMELGTFQQPYPPFWYAGNAEHAAEKCANFIGSGTIKRLPETVQRYREVWERSKTREDRLNPRVSDPKVGSTRHLLVAATHAEAEAVARRSWKAYHLNYPKRGWEQPSVPGAAGGPSLGGDFDLAMKVEAAVVGSPATVGDYVRRYEAESGSNYFVASFQWGDLTHDEALRSMRLFAGAVGLAP
jgi:alkanesulfonate monooxygenase SsuD/methylene tetrahydromethanopterin reductase-like flavin-dependent oxidoreductase (luciferase family)